MPQGYVIGPLLLNIVINDLTSATAKFDHVMYADDTTLILYSRKLWTNKGIETKHT